MKSLFKILARINKIILPNARSFCRLRGSDHSGKQFISGDTRTQFQQDFQEELARTCESQGIQIIQALITRIHPPQKIAKPVQDRQIAAQKEKQFAKQILQQESEKELAVDLGRVLPAPIRVVHAARRRSTSTERGLEGRQRQSGID